jgi:hypothetical protein
MVKATVLRDVICYGWSGEAIVLFAGSIVLVDLSDNTVELLGQWVELAAGDFQVQSVGLAS